ncbi:Sulfotransferase [Methanocaldococcus lauensis]|uniref:Sulfotransferase n=1 Tax=Methanocaldococcus lauensis TaxID=2546128 RepID=A0A8D6PWZ5_9EURY|nr:sulfotransferase [Methanocaldococcus lauensis]CAB3290097.1 Sulfotransferase [Methanocaldococcus lauensis]
MKIPNLFIIGEPKCGTTTIHYTLNTHPDIFMCPVKEPAYFCKDFHEESDRYHGKKLYYPIREEDQYLELFRDAKNEKIIGESSTLYAYSKVAAKEIYKFNPEAKIIYIIREPVDFLYSLHSHYYRNLEETIDDLKKAIEIEPLRKKWKFLPKYVPNPSILYYTERVKYYNHISKYLDMFGNDQILILTYDELKNDPKKLFKRIFDFLGVDSSYKPNIRIENVGKDIKSKLFHKLLIKGYHSNLKYVLPLKFRRKLGNFLKEINLTHKKQKQFDNNLVNYIKEITYNEIFELNKIIDMDLIKLWKYDR